MWSQLLAAETHLEAGASVDERLVEAGFALFSRRGYADVAIDDVCRSALIAKGSFYRHYPSKGALFIAVVEEMARRAGAEFAATTAPADDDAWAVDRLAAILVPYVTLILDLASLATQRHPGYGRALGRVVDELVGGFAGHTTVGALPPRETVGRALLEAVRRAAEETRGPRCSSSGRRDRVARGAACCAALFLAPGATCGR